MKLCDIEEYIYNRYGIVMSGTSPFFVRKSMMDCIDQVVSEYEAGDKRLKVFFEEVAFYPILSYAAQYKYHVTLGVRGDIIPSTRLETLERAADNGEVISQRFLAEAVRRRMRGDGLQTHKADWA